MNLSLDDLEKRLTTILLTSVGISSHSKASKIGFGQFAIRSLNFCANSSHLSVSRKLCIKSLGNSGVETFVVIWRLDYLLWASNSCVSFSRQQHRGQKAREILIKSEILWGLEESQISHMNLQSVENHILSVPFQVLIYSHYQMNQKLDFGQFFLWSP